VESKVNFTLVGFFVIALLMAVGVIVAWLTAAMDAKEYRFYRVNMKESVAGLNVNASVKYRGVDVGKVISIGLDENNPEEVKLILGIEEGTSIRQDTIARLQVQGLTGLAYVELTGGSRDAPPLLPKVENELPVIKAGPSLVARLENVVSAITTRLLTDENLDAFGATLNNLGIITGALANRADAIGQTVVNLETATGAFAARADSIGKGLGDAAKTFANSARLSAEARPLLTQASNALNRASQALDRVEKTADTFDKTGKDLSVAIRESGEDFGVVLGDVEVLLRKLQRLSDTLDRFSRKLERDPQMLLFGKKQGRPGPGE
jgi:phospholipid/cholesterol/gamma-HCH transport system substrate-binding protein